MSYTRLTVLCAIIASVLLFLSMEASYSPSSIPVMKDQYPFPKVFIYQGIYSKRYPGNSMAAIKEAAEINNAGIELSVRMSKDGVLFLYNHDKLENETNGSGLPEDLNWEKLSKLNYKGGEHLLVNLEDVFKFINGRNFLVLDVKHTKVFNNTLLNKLVNLISKYNICDKVAVVSSNPFVLFKMRKIDPNIMISYAFFGTEIMEKESWRYRKMPWLLKLPFIQKQIRRLVKPDVLSIRYDFDPELMRHLSEFGYPVFVWFVEKAEQALPLFENGATSLSTYDSKKLLSELPKTAKMECDSGYTKFFPYKTVCIKNEEDIKKALFEAKSKNRKISISGLRHSMGGQTLLTGSINLRMSYLNQVKYNPKTKTITAEAGATWRKVQEELNKHKRSTYIMQTYSSFTVGGTISINGHGLQVKNPPIASSIISMDVITADGKLVKTSLKENTELFKAIIGGYGLLGIILKVELKTTPNNIGKLESEFFPVEEFVSKYEKIITKNPNAELAYGRLSFDKKNMFDKAGIVWFEKTNKGISKKAIDNPYPSSFARLVFRYCAYSEFLKKMSWAIEKLLTKILAPKTTTRNQIMDLKDTTFWPLKGRLNDSFDVLQEYFIPKKQLAQFLIALKNNIKKYNINVLKVNIRETLKDDVSSLPYAKNDMFTLICTFNQKNHISAEINMHKFTKNNINAAIKLKGSFHLPYRLHYDWKDLIAGYPDLVDWLKLKKKYDPEEIFDSNFYQHIITIYNKEKNINPSSKNTKLKDKHQ